MPPASAVSAWLEWPPGSGRKALYSPEDQMLFRDLARALHGIRHRAGCPGRTVDAFLAGERDLEGCEFCRTANQVDVLHELKMLGARTVPEGGDDPFAGEQIDLLAGT